VIPASLQWWAELPGGAAWLARLPRLARECAAAWDLELGEAFADAYASLVVRATRPGGEPAVLKIAFPDEETRHRAEVLAWRYEGPAQDGRWLPRHIAVAHALSAAR
jgi:streptomycin 6-kinase